MVNQVNICTKHSNPDQSQRKGTLPLNVLQKFHCITNFKLDIMHDLQEGVCPYEVKSLLYRYICINRYSRWQKSSISDYIPSTVLTVTGKLINGKLSLAEENGSCKCAFQFCIHSVTATKCIIPFLTTKVVTLYFRTAFC